MGVEWIILGFLVVLIIGMAYVIHLMRNKLKTEISKVKDDDSESGSPAPVYEFKDVIPGRAKPFTETYPKPVKSSEYWPTMPSSSCRCDAMLDVTAGILTAVAISNSDSCYDSNWSSDTSCDSYSSSTSDSW